MSQVNLEVIMAETTTKIIIITTNPASLKETIAFHYLPPKSSNQQALTQ